MGTILPIVFRIPSMDYWRGAGLGACICAMDTGDGTRHRNRNQKRVVETRVVETRVVDTRNGAVLVVVDTRTVETRVVDTRNVHHDRVLYRRR